MGETSATRPTPAASGTLAKTPLIHLVLYVLNNGLSGTLELCAPDMRRALVLFLSGQPAKVWTSEQGLYLGEILMELGHLTETELTQSLSDLSAAKSAGPMVHGQLLLAAGTIDDGK